MRAVLDPNVLISAILSRSGAPAELIRRWEDGEFELVVSAGLLTELERALAYPKLDRRLASEAAEEYLAILRIEAEVVADPLEPPKLRSADADDDYLIALAAAERAALVSGDKHLLALRDELPIYDPRAFLDVVGGGKR